MIESIEEIKPLAPRNEKLARLLRLSAWLAHAARGVAILLLAANAVMWLVPGFAADIARNQSALQQSPMTLTLEARLLALLVSSLYVGLLAFALFVAARLFRGFAEGEILVPATGAGLRRLGLSLLLFAVLSPPFRAVIGLMATIGNAPGQRALAVSISSNDVVLALIAALIVVLGHVMAEAARIAEDHQHIV